MFISAELKSEIERINNVAKSMNLIVLDAEHINFPNQVKTSTLAPIVVGLRVKTAKVSRFFPALSVCLGSINFK